MLNDQRPLQVSTLITCTPTEAAKSVLPGRTKRLELDACEVRTEALKLACGIHVLYHIVSEYIPIST